MLKCLFDRGFYLDCVIMSEKRNYLFSKKTNQFEFDDKFVFFDYSLSIRYFKIYECIDDTNLANFVSFF